MVCQFQLCAAQLVKENIFRLSFPHCYSMNVSFTVSACLRCLRSCFFVGQVILISIVDYVLVRTVDIVS